MATNVAFCGSTPANKGVLDSVGEGALQAELNAMSKQRIWEDMGNLIDDSLFDKFTIVGDAKQLARQVQVRYGDIVDPTAAAYAEIDRGAKVDCIETLQAN